MSLMYYIQDNLSNLNLFLFLFSLLLYFFSFIYLAAKFSNQLKYLNINIL